MVWSNSLPHFIAGEMAPVTSLITGWVEMRDSLDILEVRTSQVTAEIEPRIAYAIA